MSAPVLRLKLETGERVLGYCREHPVPVLRFARSTADLEALIEQARVALDSPPPPPDTGEYVTRTEIERWVRQVQTVARCLVRADPGLRAAIPPVPPTTSAEDLVRYAERYCLLVEEHQARFADFGIGSDQLDHFSGRLIAFESGVRRGGMRPRTPAQGRVRRLLAERIMIVIRDLDAIYQVHYTGDRERAAAYKAARIIFWKGGSAARERDTVLEPAGAPQPS